MRSLQTTMTSGARDRGPGGDRAESRNRGHWKEFQVEGGQSPQVARAWPVFAESLVRSEGWGGVGGGDVGQEPGKARRTLLGLFLGF